MRTVESDPSQLSWRTARNAEWSTRDCAPGRSVNRASFVSVRTGNEVSGEEWAEKRARRGRVEGRKEGRPRGGEESWRRRREAGRGSLVVGIDQVLSSLLQRVARQGGRGVVQQVR
jgi:hypothetical protein